MAKEPVPVRKCACGHAYVGDRGCPECGAPWLLTSLVMCCSSRKKARLVAADVRARGKEAEEWHKGRNYDHTIRGSRTRMVK